MRILIDLQGAQTGSRHRGIGRYSSALAKAIIRNRGDHEVFILLNGLFQATIDPLKEDLSALLPAGNLLVFSAPGPVEGLVSADAWRKEAAELIREWVINDIAPDILLLTSLFEGAIDDGITSIRRLETTTKVAVILYDLIPFLDPNRYLAAPADKNWYEAKIDSLRRADLLLAISDSARREATDALGFDGNRTVSIYSAADERFRADASAAAENQEFLERKRIRGKFVMHASAFEPRKNFEGLIRAFALLPKRVREGHQLVLVAAIALDHQIALRRLADDVGLGPNEMIFAGYVSDAELIVLYSLCTLFVLPSFHEGFGLPALEAMCCGAAVIGSNATSIPEVIGREDALFDPNSDLSMAALIERALTDTAFWQSLKAHSLQWSKRFSWDRSAKLALRAIEGLAPFYPPSAAAPDASMLLGKIAGIRADVSPDRKDLVAVADSISRNERSISQWRLARSAAGGDTAAEVDRAPTAAAQGGGRYDAQRAYPPGVEVIRHQIWLPDERPRILLLKLDHIGDFIMTLGAFRLIRNTWPKAHITLVCGPWNKSLAEQSEMFNEVLCCDFFAEAGVDYDKESMLEHGLARYRELALGSYDLAVDLRYYGDSRVLLVHSDAKYRAGYAASDIGLDLALPEIPETGMMAHIGARIMALAAAVAWTFGTPAGAARDVLLHGRAPIGLFDDGIVVGIAPGTGNPIKSWGRERFAELARLLHEMGGYRFVLIGSNRDRSDTQFVAQSLPKEHFVDLAGTLSIAELPPILAGLDLFIGNDTGTTHMAALAGIPTVCVFSGQSHVHSWRPVGAHVVTLRGAVNCSPCYLVDIQKCPRNHWCMDIPPSRVAAEAIELRERLYPLRLQQDRKAAGA